MSNRIAVIPVHVVFEESGDYGTPGKLVGVFTNKVRADVAAQGRGSWGGASRVREGHAIVMGEATYLLQEKEPVRLDINLAAEAEHERDVALSKLSLRERSLLGIK